MLKYCIASYDEWLINNPGAHPLSNLTHHLVSTKAATAASIRRRMSAKWTGDPEAAQKIESSVTNSLRRSAGTNYQALVSYALARYLHKQKSCWYVMHPVPSTFAHSLAIRFTGGLAPEAEVDGNETEAGGQQIPDLPADSAAVVIKPDLDILLRNASWKATPAELEPVLVLSVKTSLADRAGAAARWKMYFDLVTKPCIHICETGCAYQKLGIELAHDPRVNITHGIVTANIYKIDSDPYFTQWGELRSNQARGNTFMFDLRYTTREESADVMAEGWESLTQIEHWLASVAKENGLTP